MIMFIAIYLIGYILGYILKRYVDILDGTERTNKNVLDDLKLSVFSWVLVIVGLICLLLYYLERNGTTDKYQKWKRKKTKF